MNNILYEKMVHLTNAWAPRARSRLQLTVAAVSLFALVFLIYRLSSDVIFNDVSSEARTRVCIQCHISVICHDKHLNHNNIIWINYLHAFRCMHTVYIPYHTYRYRTDTVVDPVVVIAKDFESL